MEAKYFRIGNLVTIETTALHSDGLSDKNKVFEISELKTDVVQFKGFHAGEYYKDIKGVYLNASELKNLGVRHNGLTPYWLPLPKMKAELHFEIYGSEIVATLKSQFSDLILEPLRYVHDLQNLFFALMNEELEYKTDR